MTIEDTFRTNFLEVTEKDILIALALSSPDSVFRSLRAYFSTNYSSLYAATAAQYLEKEGERAVLYRAIRGLSEDKFASPAEIMRKTYPLVYSNLKQNLEKSRKRHDFSNVHVEEIDWSDRSSAARLD